MVSTQRVDRSMRLGTAWSVPREYGSCGPVYEVGTAWSVLREYGSCGPVYEVRDSMVSIQRVDRSMRLGTAWSVPREWTGL